MKEKVTVRITYLEMGKKVTQDFEGPLTSLITDVAKYSIIEFKKGKRSVLTILARDFISAVTLSAVAVCKRELKLIA